MNEIFLGSAISGGVGFLLAIPAMIVERRRRKQADIPLLLDIRFLWKVKLNDREVFAVSLLFHLLIALLVGGFYVWFAQNGWLFFTHAPFSFRSVMIFTFATWLVAGNLLFPLIGLGWFARREGRHMWFDMLVTHFLIGTGFWLGVQFYRPFFF